MDKTKLLHSGTPCQDCIKEQEEYGAKHCPVHYKTAVCVGDSLYNKIDKTLYLVLQVDYDKYYILLLDTKGKEWVISSNPQTLNKFELIKN